MNSLLDGMVRRPDHSTSIAAAIKVRRRTLREVVIDEALSEGAVGITDDELKARYPQTPESSVRKRRTELAQENVLLESGRVRKNRHGQEEKVWMHRDFHWSPPPLVDRAPPMSKDHQITILEAQKRALQFAMREAIARPEQATSILTAALAAIN